MALHLSADEFENRLDTDVESLSVALDVPVVVVEQPLANRLAGRFDLLPCLVLGTRPDPLVDAVVTPDDLAAVELVAGSNPQALVATALLLRGVGSRSVEQSLVAESTTYSLLQGGAEFRTWRESRPVRERPRPREIESDPVLVVRHGSRLDIELNRPDRRNAYSRRMRDQLAEALTVALVDDSIATVVLRGRGSNFSSGGDLDEFGSFVTPVQAHVSRLTSSVAHMLHRLRERLGDRLVGEVHGANFGAGVELPAFCGRVIARADTTMCLPEVSLGLVPGAGGTASISARVGRQRTALMAFTAKTIDSRTALSWGLVDEIIP